MWNTTIVEMKHFVVWLKLRVLFDLTNIAQVQHDALLAFKDEVLRTNLNEFLFVIILLI